MRGPFTRGDLDDAYGKGNWREMIRFGVWQKGKLRGCDNGRGSLHNEGVYRHEKLVCEAADFPARVARALARACEVLDLPPPAMIGGTDDLSAAYRHVPTDSPNMTVVALLDPDSGEVWADAAIGRRWPHRIQLPTLQLPTALHTGREG